jgi:transposase-like protein
MRQAEPGTPVPEVCRKLGIAEQTFYRWKKKYAGMGVTEVRKLRILEEKNRKFKQPVAAPPPPVIGTVSRVVLAKIPPENHILSGEGVIIGRTFELEFSLAI